MVKKVVIFIIIGVIFGIAGALGGVFFMMNKANEPEVVEPVVEAFDLKDGTRLTLEKVQVPLLQTDNTKHFLQADFTIVFKSEEALALAEGMNQDIKDAIMSVFEVKTATELTQVGARNDMKEPVLKAIRELYNSEEDRENIVAIMISSFIVT